MSGQTFDPKPARLIGHLTEKSCSHSYSIQSSNLVGGIVLIRQVVNAQPLNYSVKNARHHDQIPANPPTTERINQTERVDCRADSFEWFQTFARRLLRPSHHPAFCRAGIADNDSSRCGRQPETFSIPRPPRHLDPVRHKPSQSKHGP